MIKSMTGFGRGEYSENGRHFIVEIKTVNHRYSDVYIKMPRNISFLEDKIREFVIKSISRGKADIFVTFEDLSGEGTSVFLDESLAEKYVEAAKKLRDMFNLNDDISASFISRMPDVVRLEKQEVDAEYLWTVLKNAVEKALLSLLSMRETEGKELRKSLIEKSEYIENILLDIKERSPEVVKEYRVKLDTRLNELLNGQNIDEQRLAVECAIFADRCSIDEELVRFKSHIAQFKDTLWNDNQTIGRKLDFIVQEMNREINTIGSKANDLIITRNVVDVKSEIEKIREQVQNIE